MVWSKHLNTRKHRHQVSRVDLTHPVADAEHGKAVGSHLALAVPRQADRKAGPGDNGIERIEQAKAAL